MRALIVDDVGRKSTDLPEQGTHAAELPADLSNPGFMERFEAYGLIKLRYVGLGQGLRQKEQNFGILSKGTREAHGIFPKVEGDECDSQPLCGVHEIVARRFA